MVNSAKAQSATSYPEHQALLPPQQPQLYDQASFDYRDMNYGGLGWGMRDGMGNRPAMQQARPQATHVQQASIPIAQYTQALQSAAHQSAHRAMNARDRQQVREMDPVDVPKQPDSLQQTGVGDGMMEDPTAVAASSTSSSGENDPRRRPADEGSPHGSRGAVKKRRII